MWMINRLVGSNAIVLCGIIHYILGSTSLYLFFMSVPYGRSRKLGLLKGIL